MKPNETQDRMWNQGQQALDSILLHRVYVCFILSLIHVVETYYHIPTIVGEPAGYFCMEIITTVFN